MDEQTSHTPTSHTSAPRMRTTNRGNQTNPWMVSTLVLAGLVVGFGIAQIPYFKSMGGATQATTVPPSQDQIAQQPTEPPPPPRELTPEEIAKLPDDDTVIGRADALITMVEFSDFQCPYCGRFFTTSFSDIEQNYINTGKVKLIYRDFPLDGHIFAEPAALAAECADEQGKFREMHDILFTNQNEWSRSDKPADMFKDYARQIKLAPSQFNQCYDTKKYSSEVRKDLVDGYTFGVEGTPAFFINGKLVSGAMPYEQVFKPIFEAELAGKKWRVVEFVDPETRRPNVRVDVE